MFSALRNALRDDARAYEYNLNYAAEPTYAELKMALLQNYGDSAKMYFF